VYKNSILAKEKHSTDEPARLRRERRRLPERTDRQPDRYENGPDGSSYIKELTLGNIWVVHGYSNDIFQADLDAQAAKRKFRVLHALPKEGAVLALDSMVIHRSAPRPDLAHMFINFMLDGKNSADLTNMIGSGNPNTDAQQYIKPEIKQVKAVFPDAAAAKTLEMLKDFNSKQRRTVNKIWTEIKVK
jgi:spermidine/putrescine transport system substrate-binding protein